MTGSGHWQVMLTVASPTWKLDRRSVPLMPDESLTSPEYHSRLFTARLCVPAHPLHPYKLSSGKPGNPWLD